MTQSPSDIPDAILGQLGNRIQHALRAFTPKDQKAVKTAAETFRPNPAFKTADAIMELETGEALVSFLDEKGAPSIVERAKILFPLSQIGAITDTEREQTIRQSRLYGRYDNAIDRESAFEILLKQAEAQAHAEEEAKEAELARKQQEKEEKEKSKKKSGGIGSKILGAIATAFAASVAKSVGSAVSDAVSGKKSSSSSTKKTVGKAASSAAQAATRTVTKELTRSILGNLIK